MGLVKHGRLLFGVGLIALAAYSCNSSKSSNVSSKSFLAPQLLSGNAGGGAVGEKAVELMLNKVDILREVYRNPDGTPGKLDSELKNAPCRVVPFGMIDERRLLVLESETKTVLSIDLISSSVRKQMTRDEIIAVFNGQTQKPVLGVVLPLKSGWLLGYETSTKSIYAVRADPADPLQGGIIMILLMDQAEIQRQWFPVTPKVQVTVKSFYEFLPNQILIVPANTNLAASNHLALEDSGTSLTGEIQFPDSVPFLEYSKIKNQTGNVDVDIRDFQPIGIPGTNRFLMFDRARDTSSFLEIEAAVGEDNVIRSLVHVTARRDDLLNAIQNANQGGSTFTGQFRLSTSLYNPEALRAPTDRALVPLIYAFDEETNNMLSYDFTAPVGDAHKVGVMTSQTQITSRIDLNFDPNLDSGTFDPQLRFATDSVTDNKLAFDVGPSQLLSFNYETGQVVVVFHKRDITVETLGGLLEVNFVQAIDAPPTGSGKELRIFDASTSSLLTVRLEYVSIPLKVTRR